MTAKLRLGCALAWLVPVSLSSGQLFDQPQVAFEWNCDMVARTLAQSDSSVLCERFWSTHVVDDAPLSTMETLTATNGGCQLVSLGRGVNFRIDTPPGRATLTASLQTQAANSFETMWYGQAAGNADSDATLRIQLRAWARADLLVSFAADVLQDNVSAQLDATFRGPIDPSTDTGVLFNYAWIGDTHTTFSHTSVLLPPGTYELTAVAQAEFLAVSTRFFDSVVAASARFTSVVPDLPGPETDLDADGWVGLSDACAWPGAPTDANADGTINDADFDFLLAIVRAAGEAATDDNADGIADQCSCPADWNGDDSVDFFDVQAFLQAFALHRPEADLTGDGIYNFFDLQEFLNRFSVGC